MNEIDLSDGNTSKNNFPPKNWTFVQKTNSLVKFRAMCLSQIDEAMLNISVIICTLITKSCTTYLSGYRFNQTPNHIRGESFSYKKSRWNEGRWIFAVFLHCHSQRQLVDFTEQGTTISSLLKTWIWRHKDARNHVWGNLFSLKKDSNYIYLCNFNGAQ